MSGMNNWTVTHFPMRVYLKSSVKISFDEVWLEPTLSKSKKKYICIIFVGLSSSTSKFNCNIFGVLPVSKCRRNGSKWCFPQTGQPKSKQKFQLKLKTPMPRNTNKREKRAIHTKYQLPDFLLRKITRFVIEVEENFNIPEVHNYSLQ